MQTSPPAQPGTLHSRTLALLKDDGRSLPLVASQSGLPFYWLKKFSAGEIHDPSVNRIQKLYEFLAKRPLRLVA